MSNLIEHAKRELALLRGDSTEPDPMQDMMEKHILSMVEEFSKEGHSGFSASYAISILNRLLQFRPVTPLTGEDHEWNDVRDGLLQNNRCIAVFKSTKTGEAFYIEGNVFRNQHGHCYTNYLSKVPVTFPWTPPEKTNFVDVWEAPEEAQ